MKVGTIFKNPVFMQVCRHGIVKCMVSERWRKEEEEGRFGWQQDCLKGRDFLVFFRFFFCWYKWATSKKYFL